MLRLLHRTVPQSRSLHLENIKRQFFNRWQSSAQPDTVVFSGIQPTGIPHLGNYLGALKQWVELQEKPTASFKLIYSIVDLHALTMRQDREQLRQWKRETLATLLAIGLDPNRSTIFFQSDVPAHSQLMWIISCTASMGYLSRMTQWKAKLSLRQQSRTIDPTTKASLKLGLFSYPVLQAADILVHGATHVPVGEDQTQHLEFARECANNFNYLHGDVLKPPQIMLSPVRRVMSLRDPFSKMSKSHKDSRSRILITDTAHEIRAKIRASLTDSNPAISYDRHSRPAISNLLDLLSYFDPSKNSPETLADVYKNTSIRAFKEVVSDRVNNALAPIRNRYVDLISDSRDGRLEEVAKVGADAAQINSSSVLRKVYNSVGI